MSNTVVIIGGSAGADIAAEIFSSQYENIKYIETYSERVKNEDIIAKKISDGLEYLRGDVDYFIATGDNKQRKDNYDQVYKHTQKNPVNCIHKSSIVSPTASIGYGNLLCPGSIVHTNAVIGNNTIINTGSVIEHDCMVEDYSQVSPNVTLCGRAVVEQFSFVGAGSVVIPKIKIGYGSIVAAGSAVIKNTEAESMYAGVPAVFKKKIK